MINENDHESYIIPPNFIESGTFFGGIFKARNVIEAGILSFSIGVPVFLWLPFGLTARIIVLCLTALPPALLALIGISGESLTSFLVIFLKYLKNRRVIGGESGRPQADPKPKATKKEKVPGNAAKVKKTRRRFTDEQDFPAEFDEAKGYEIRQKLRPPKKKKPDKVKSARVKSGCGTQKGCPPPGNSLYLFKSGC